MSTKSNLYRHQLDRFRRKEKFTYYKLNDSTASDKLLSLINSNKDMPLHVVVLNFIDMLSHARTESKMIRELANSDAAYRSITESWFRHSGAIEIFRRLAELGYKVISPPTTALSAWIIPSRWWVTAIPIQIYVTR